MDIYFEFNDSAIGREFNSFQHPIPAKYCVRYCATDLPGGPIYPLRLMHYAERIWQEDDTGIKFIKNRNGNPETTPVDMKEFFWVKLSSKEV
jgi:hypothetical protein